MVTFNDVKEKFEEHKCQLLMTEDEFNLKPRTTQEKYPYIASCGHNHNVWFHIFKMRLTGVFCPKCVILRDAINQKEKCKLNPLSNLNLEYTILVYFKTLIGDKFDVKFNGEGCLADCCIKPKNSIDDKWLMIQMKSTLKPKRGYEFKSSSKYKNCLLMCICESDKKMWGFFGDTITTTKISIGLNNSKYDENEFTTDTIHEKMTYYYNELPKYNFETINIPINPKQQLEHEYRIYREKMVNTISFIENEKQGLVYDFIINNFKVQEKVCSYKKNKNGIHFTLNKNNGKKKEISYQQGDNDFYWLNVNNKKHFYIIPEHELLSRNHINTEKHASIYLTPNSKKGKNSWANEYLFDYTKIDEEKMKRMFVSIYK